ncbi:hypothetical protein TrRE_jg1125 [Triparma retinervis]|uniref:FYVE-type domain-containing protein n=1 Tax=Triparma retinervis TaxID=2557542 RepID=A0A9W7DTU0_9STRA|nr:hypothetical protein TrRE_jg1125 [Triparma retinervis]
MGREIFETSIRRSSQDFGNESPVGNSYAPTPQDNGTVGTGSAVPAVNLFDASFDVHEMGMERAAELARYSEEAHKHLFENNRIIKEGKVTKYNRTGGSDKPHFILTTTHLLMVELTLVARTIKFRQAFKITDVKVGLQPNHKLRIETVVKSFDIGLDSDSECWSWKEALIDAITSARLAENLPANYEKSLAFSAMWDANTPRCQLCQRDFSLLVRRHHCRNCGKCVCGTCAFSKVRMDQVDENKLQRVCNVCADELKAARSMGYGGNGGYGAAA